MTKRSIIIWIILTAIVAGTVVFRARLIDLPLERDEGEYAYVAQQMLLGIPPYESAYTIKLPGTHLAYAAIVSIFGETARGVHLGLILVNSLTILIIFLIARRMFDPLSALVAATVYSALSLSPIVLGMNAHATHFVVLFASLGIFFVLRTIENQSIFELFAGGICLGLAIIMKQAGIFFAPFAALFYLWSARRMEIAWKNITRHLTIFVIGVALPFILTCAVLYFAGVFDKFWFWTFTYAREYAGRTTELDAKAFLRNIIPYLAIVIVSVISIVAIILRKGTKPCTIFVVGLLVFSIAAICPGFAFRKHYFVIMLPAVAMLFASVVHVFDKRKKQVAIILIIIVCASLAIDREYLFMAAPCDASRMAYGTNPFSEAEDIARFVEMNTEPDESIAILGSEPEILFYAKRRSATRYIYMYEMMEEHSYAGSMQLEMISEIESAKPEILIFVRIEPSWSPMAHSAKDLFTWFEDYKKDFNLVLKKQVTPNNYVLVFKRHNNA